MCFLPSLSSLALSLSLSLSLSILSLLSLLSLSVSLSLSLSLSLSSLSLSLALTPNHYSSSLGGIPFIQGPPILRILRDQSSSCKDTSSAAPRSKLMGRQQLVWAPLAQHGSHVELSWSPPLRSSLGLSASWISLRHAHLIGVRSTCRGSFASSCFPSKAARSAWRGRFCRGRFCQKKLGLRP